MRLPRYLVVPFGNRMPNSKCMAMAKLPLKVHYYPFDDGLYCGGQMPEDLLNLVPMDPRKDTPNPFQAEQRGTVPFSVQDNGIIYLHQPTDKWCLLRDDNLYEFPSLLRGPLALLSTECLETFAFAGFDPTVENHNSVWEAFSNYPCLSNLWTSITMRMINGEFDNKYNSEHTVPLCNLIMGSLPQCTMYRT
jgi:hypothetical protein